MPPIRVLLLADSHLGFDLPLRPRVERRRRGHDFLANHQRALEPARAGQVDLVVHGGDVFHRSRVPSSLVYQAFQPLIEVADSGVPVVVVPGNHERSRIPHRRLTGHPNLHIFDKPDTTVVEIRGTRVALAGFPYVRKNIRDFLPEVLERTGWHRREANLRLLCVHHCVEGATVGPGNYTFRSAKDVISCADLPVEFAAVLSGHIHRHQVLTTDPSGRRLHTPVLYPGSVERTAFAEMGEEKGFMVLEFEPNGRGGSLIGNEFIRLPARPMVEQELRPKGSSDHVWSREDLEGQLKSVIASAPIDAVLRIRLRGEIPMEVRPFISAARLRDVAPLEMNMEVITPTDRSRRSFLRSKRAAPASGLATGIEPQPSPAQIQACLFG